jgi:hypothetical protein
MRRITPLAALLFLSGMLTVREIGIAADVLAESAPALLEAPDHLGRRLDQLDQHALATDR